jgi:hypothetical protein
LQNRTKMPNIRRVKAMIRTWVIVCRIIRDGTDVQFWGSFGWVARLISSSVI